MKIHHYKILFISVLILSISLIGSPIPSKAQDNYVPPQTIVINMYELRPNGGTTRRYCTYLSRANGCAESGYSYPFTSGIITIGIDDANGPDNNTSGYPYPYLWDVLAKEYGLIGSQGVKPPSGVMAQAIASRTYVYQRIQFGYSFDNTASSSQVFVPYGYVGKTGGGSDFQALMERATNSRYYMTPDKDNPATEHDESIYPIAAFFCADNLSMTIEGVGEGKTEFAMTNYVKAVLDPINADFGC